MKRTSGCVCELGEHPGRSFMAGPAAVSTVDSAACCGLPPPPGRYIIDEMIRSADPKLNPEGKGTCIIDMVSSGRRSPLPPPLLSCDRRGLPRCAAMHAPRPQR